MMVVLLKNLVARAPQTKDLDAISRLIAACENAGSGMMDHSLEELLPCWQCADFHPTTDAWVIATTRGQMVGFACVWHQEHVQISTFVCVDPAYRNRGIGTLLLRLVEVRARQQSRFAQPGDRVVLRGLISTANAGAQSLFEREGYQEGQRVLRIAFRQAQESSELPVPTAQKELRANISLEPNWLGVAPLYAQDGLCTICLYRTYEKELRSTSTPCTEAQARPVALNTSGSYAIARAS